MSKVYQVRWVQNNGNQTIHGTYRDYDTAMQSIRHWWSVNKFTPNYVRTWQSATNESVTRIDYGMHDVFYEIHEISLNQTFNDVDGNIDSHLRSGIKVNKDIVELKLYSQSIIADDEVSSTMQIMNLTKSQLLELGAWLVANGERING